MDGPFFLPNVRFLGKCQTTGLHWDADGVLVNLLSKANTLSFKIRDGSCLCRGFEGHETSSSFEKDLLWYCQNISHHHFMPSAYFFFSICQGTAGNLTHPEVALITSKLITQPSYSWLQKFVPTVSWPSFLTASRTSIPIHLKPKVSHVTQNHSSSDFLFAVDRLGKMCITFWFIFLFCKSYLISPQCLPILRFKENYSYLHYSPIACVVEEK